MYASMEGWLDRVKFLLARGAKLNTVASLPDNLTALMGACRGRHQEVSRELRDRGAIVNATFNGNFTVLFGASMHGLVDVVRLLLQRGRTSPS